ncbi:PAAR domain-containing protein [Photorhabdus antumapuensis]|nr:PAAR domain-containing protein [Photorhabdus antumapuensis]
MAIGYYLLVGDKTTCGGQIITGDHTMTFNGIPADDLMDAE